MSVRGPLEVHQGSLGSNRDPSEVHQGSVECSLGIRLRYVLESDRWVSQ